VTVVNDGTYGCDYADGELRLSLLRATGYSAHPDADGPHVPPDRHSPRADQGPHTFRFWLNAGPLTERLAAVDREALRHNEPPMVLSFFPGGEGALPRPFATLSDEAIQITALKKAEAGEELIIRLFEPTGQARSATLRLPFTGLEQIVSLGAFEIQTWRVGAGSRRWERVDLMEQAIAADQGVVSRVS
jgi:alpha-mannosidase